jgi:hypothetical protein
MPYAPQGVKGLDDENFNKMCRIFVTKVEA